MSTGEGRLYFIISVTMCLCISLVFGFVAGRSERDNIQKDHQIREMQNLIDQLSTNKRGK